MRGLFWRGGIIEVVISVSRERGELLALAALAVVAPFLLPEYKAQLSFLWIFVLFALTWDLQGGQMGYNSFGNIAFFGIGMYASTATQIALFFDRRSQAGGELTFSNNPFRKSAIDLWTQAGGELTFIHLPWQYFAGFAAGLIIAAILPAAAALALGSLILSMRGQYFAICTLGFGIAMGEIAASVEILGAGSGMTVPVWPDGYGGLPARDWLLYLMCPLAALCCFVAMRAAHKTRFGLALNAIRDDEDKAEAMGLPVVQCKVKLFASALSSSGRLFFSQGANVISGLPFVRLYGVVCQAMVT